MHRVPCAVMQRCVMHTFSTGGVTSGLIFHPDGQHLIYPLGSTIVIRNLASSHSQRFLHGHKDRVSCVAMSPSGRYLASGQVTHMGFTVRRAHAIPTLSLYPHCMLIGSHYYLGLRDRQDTA